MTPVKRDRRKKEKNYSAGDNKIAQNYFMIIRDAMSKAKLF